jgi:hypothetical protein
MLDWLAFWGATQAVGLIVKPILEGYKPQRFRDAEFRHFMLQDLESEQIQDFIHRWHELTFKDAADKVKKRERLQRAIESACCTGDNYQAIS